MEKDMNMLTIEVILQRLNIDLSTIQQQDATEIVKVILAYMIEDSARHLEKTEMPIGELLWVE